jgi:molybdate transport system substrate-binding protein
MKKFLAFQAAVLCFSFFGAPVFGAGAKEKQGVQAELIIAAAASLTDAMNEAIAAYRVKAPSVTVTPTYGASGSLQRQIEQGAPADIFFSAAPRQMDELERQGLVIDGTRRNLLENKVVLIVPRESTGIASFNDAASVRQIALGEPGSVPVGQYAEQIFTSLGILEAVKARAVYAKDVRQVLSYVEQAEVEAGVVYATDASISKTVTVAAFAPAGSHAPVVYPAALVNTGLQADAARSFLEWLSSPEAGAIFTKYGFSRIAAAP